MQTEKKLIKRMPIKMEQPVKKKRKTTEKETNLLEHVILLEEGTFRYENVVQMAFNTVEVVSALVIDENFKLLLNKEDLLEVKNGIVEAVQKDVDVKIKGIADESNKKLIERSIVQTYFMQKVL